MLPLVPLLFFACPGFGSRTLGGGNAEVPADPTYVDHVGPILDTYCAPCHGETPSGGAPDYFRLDAYESDGSRDGASEMADRIEARATGDSPTMPPSYASQPSDIDREIIAAWIADGAPYGADSGGAE